MFSTCHDFLLLLTSVMQLERREAIGATLFSGESRSCESIQLR